MTTGVITGGWEFVWAAYGVSFALYALYTTVIITRWRHERRKVER